MNLTLVGLHPVSMNFVKRLWICYFIINHSWGQECTLEAREHTMYISGKTFIHMTCIYNKGKHREAENKKKKKTLLLVSIPPSTLPKHQTVVKANLTHGHDLPLDLQRKLIDTACSQRLCQQSHGWRQLWEPARGGTEVQAHTVWELAVVYTS